MHVDEKTVTVNVHYDDCQLRAEEVEIAIQKLFHCVSWSSGKVGGERAGCIVGECPLLVKKDGIED